MSENAAVLRDLFHLLCADQIGRGMTRVVYTSPLFPDWVIKVEDGAQCFQNVIEWETWERVKDSPAAKWFAPCFHVSACGSVLIMAKTSRPYPKDYLEKMPVFLTDFKRMNYGMYQGRLVCHDYGTHLLIEHGQTKRMKKANWWDEK